MEGFKIICNKCNNEIVLKNNFEGVCIENMIEAYPTTDGRVGIICIECENEIIKSKF